MPALRRARTPGVGWVSSGRHTRLGGLWSCALQGRVPYVNVDEEDELFLHTERLSSPIISLEGTNINEDVFRISS